MWQFSAQHVLLLLLILFIPVLYFNPIGCLFVGCAFQFDSAVILLDYCTQKLTVCDYFETNKVEM